MGCEYKRRQARPCPQGPKPPCDKSQRPVAPAAGCTRGKACKINHLADAAQVDAARDEGHPYGAHYKHSKPKGRERIVGM